jgi:RNA polymerase sigma-70 factor (ECF subfamily)
VIGEKMTESENPDADLVQRIRDGDADAWGDLIARYEGRLLAFAESRLRRRQASEDIVQETFIGFLNSLPNYDGRRPLESYLFTICAYKLTDHLRREGRRPTLALSAASGSSGTWEIAGGVQGASSIARHGERRKIEEAALVEALRDQIAHWRKRGDWVKIKCMELLFIRGRANKEVADLLGITEQQVANYKFDFLARMQTSVKKQGLSRDVFPELHGD